MTRTTGFIVKGIGALVLLAGGGVLWHQVAGDPTLEKLLTENRQLRQAITNLSEETQIGYAKVLEQERRKGVLFTRLLFVDTQPNDPLKPAMKKEFMVEGDVVHFDTLIVTFGQQMVMDGTERAIYLWRRIYGEKTPPEQGQAIQEPGTHPRRYEQLSERLSMQDRDLFWNGIWDLANDRNRLNALGVSAVYGNVVYNKLQPGLIYVFKIGNTGKLYLEVVPDL